MAGSPGKINSVIHRRFPKDRRSSLARTGLDGTSPPGLKDLYLGDTKVSGSAELYAYVSPLGVHCDGCGWIGECSLVAVPGTRSFLRGGGSVVGADRYDGSPGGVQKYGAFGTSGQQRHGRTGLTYLWLKAVQSVVRSPDHRAYRRKRGCKFQCRHRAIRVRLYIAGFVKHGATMPKDSRVY